MTIDNWFETPWGQFLISAFAGVVVLLAFKYAVFGLDAWNGVLHPGRSEDETGWEQNFTKPLLGAFS